MKKFALTVFYSLVALMLVIIAGGYALPDRAHVERQMLINAPREKIFAIVSDLRRLPEWSPWFSLDPKMKTEFSGEPGLGQKLVWSSDNPNVGKGTQETIEYVLNEKVVSSLDLSEMGKATASVLLKPEGSGTLVTWAFDAALPSIIERWFGLLFDRFVGADFEKGLASLKSYVEKAE